MKEIVFQDMTDGMIAGILKLVLRGFAEAVAMQDEDKGEEAGQAAFVDGVRRLRKLVDELVEKERMQG